jgi:hypothetical protein
VYSDRSSEYEQVLIGPLLPKTKNWNMDGGLNLKLTFFNVG